MIIDVYYCSSMTLISNTMSTFEIIATIGPSSDDKSTILKLLEHGATDLRINLSHTNEEKLDSYVNLFRKNDIKYSLDTQGAQVRILELQSKKSEISVEAHEAIVIYEENCKADLARNEVLINHTGVFGQLEIGDRIKIDFEGVIACVTEIFEGGIVAKVLNSGTIKVNKAFDVVGKSLTLNSLTEYDKKIISKYANEDAKRIYFSFCNDARDLASAKSLVRTETNSSLEFVAKIETSEGLNNLQEIALQSDAVLIDRGDLSREIRISMIPIATSSVLETCRALSKKCFIATNILDSMMSSKLPSRAEISDIYNLMMLGTDGLVLAAEAAIGCNPVESVYTVNHMRNLFELNQRRLLGVINKAIPQDIDQSLREWL